MLGLALLAIGLFLLLFLWRGFRRDASMSWGYCFVQTLCWCFVRLFYRVEVRGLANLPTTGGALIVCNHVAYVDVILLGVLSPRPIRFLSWEGFERNPIIGKLTRLMRTIPVAEDKAKEAIQKSTEALKAGELVCIFPEGSLTRNGDVPIVPVAMDGLWGSIFSHLGGKSFFKWPKHFPRPVAAVFGQPFPASEHAQTRLRLLELAAEAFSLRPSLRGHLGREVAVGLAAKGGQVALVDRTGARRAYSGALVLSLAWVIAKRLRVRTTARRVAIVLPPGIAAAVANLACVLAGKTPVNLNFTLGREQVQSCLRRAEVDLVITAEAFKAKLSEKFADFPWGDRVWDIAAELQSLPRWQVAWRLGMVRALPSRLIPVAIGVPSAGGDEEAALLFTSGSSGEPKGVVLSHRNLLANLRQIEDADILPASAVLLSSLPVFHSFGFTVGLWYCLSRDGTLVTLPSPLDTNAAVKAIKEEGVTVTVGTPTFLRPYLRRATAEDLKTLEWAVVGAEKLPEDLAQGFAEQLKTPMLEGYGITETSPVLAVNVPDKTDAEAPNGIWKGNVRGSVGRPVMGVAVRFIDVETGAPLAVGQVGLLEVWGANVFSGYLGDPGRTAEAKVDGWYRTGDLARLDEEGFLHLAGRLSRFSKIGGEMVPHGTVEQALLKVLNLQSSAEVVLAVSAASDPAKGEQLVVLHTMELEADAVRAALAAEGLANLWIPKVFKKVPSIPILGTGKLDLNKLRQLAQG
jgi:acyl-[acyl-carrier-protein]-phospholipid O-acyltransferase/long-chain-fatty-acid--[acyl-carrier-protein] ligase